MIKEINKFNNPPKIAIRLANIVFVCGALISVLIAVYALYKKLYPPPFANISDSFYYTFLLLGVISTILFVLGLRLHSNLKVNLSLVIISLGISIYVFERKNSCPLRCRDLDKRL